MKHRSGHFHVLFKVPAPCIYDPRLRQMDGTPAQIDRLMRARDGTPTVDVEALLRL